MEEKSKLRIRMYICFFVTWKGPTSWAHRCIILYMYRAYTQHIYVFDGIFYIKTKQSWYIFYYVPSNRKSCSIFHVMDFKGADSFVLVLFFVSFDWISLWANAYSIVRLSVCTFSFIIFPHRPIFTWFFLLFFLSSFQCSEFSFAEEISGGHVAHFNIYTRRNIFHAFFVSCWFSLAIKFGAFWRQKEKRLSILSIFKNVFVKYGSRKGILFELPKIHLPAAMM